MNKNFNQQNKKKHNNNKFTNPNLSNPNLTNGVILVPQYNKYISIFNTHTPTQTSVLNTNNKEKELSNLQIPKKTQSNSNVVPKITRIVVKRPNNLDTTIDNCENNDDDNIISSIISNILSGNSSIPIENK